MHMMLLLSVAHSWTRPSLVATASISCWRPSALPDSSWTKSKSVISARGPTGRRATPIGWQSQRWQPGTLLQGPHHQRIIVACAGRDSINYSVYTKYGRICVICCQDDMRRSYQLPAAGIDAYRARANFVNSDRIESTCRVYSRIL